MKKIKLFIVSILIILNSATLIADDFNDWKVKFKKRAIKEGVSKATVDKLIDRSKFLSTLYSEDTLLIILFSLFNIIFPNFTFFDEVLFEIYVFVSS